MTQKTHTSLSRVGLCVLFSACSVPTPEVDGGTAEDAQTAPDVGCPPGDLVCGADTGTGTLTPRPRDCEPGTEWIYLIGTETVTSRERRSFLLRYEPDGHVLTTIGELGCGITPFSMAVDRDGTAWVLSARGEFPGLFRVDTSDASCAPTSYVPNVDGWEEFGMGFAADAPGSPTETLYVLGGRRDTIHREGGEVRLGALDWATMTLETRGTTTGMGELTGTGEGNLWAFESSGLIARLDPTTAVRAGGSYTAPADYAMAIAFWGGDFYVFVASLSGDSQVYWVDTRRRVVEQVGTTTGFQIAGAGVSTCAPYIVF